MAKRVYHVFCAVKGVKAYGGFIEVEKGEVQDQEVYDYSGIGCDICECNLMVLKNILKRIGNKADILFDYEFIVEVFKNNYIKKWEFNRWKTLRDKEVSNKDLWIEVRKLMKGKNIRIMGKDETCGYYGDIKKLVVNSFN